MHAPDVTLGSKAMLKAAPARRSKPVAIWLLICCAAVAAMVLIGGITRLTDSGLSIAEWKPLMGALPPMSEAAWDRVFDLYRQTSEYRLVNAGMSLAEFKAIFWWEYIHRLWGRLIGVLFIVPLTWFWLRGRLDRRLGLKLLGIFLLGGVQGAIGWWMVASGLTGRTDVSPYRLTVHLGIAFLIFALLLWTALDLLAPARRPPASRAARRWSRIALVMISLTVVAGALVAGTDGGLVYNTFPLMGGSLVPPDYFTPTTFPHNVFENPVANQFNHRVVAIATVIAVALFWWRARHDPIASTPAEVLLAVACAQAMLGVTAVLLVVPLHVAIAHQAGALALFGVAVWTTHAIR